MPVIATEQDPAARTLTLTARFPVPVDRVWRLWADPRQLEQWWGPPGWPATFTRHDFTVGGESRYHMTGPAGERAPGWWTMTAISAPDSLSFEDGFAGEDGEPVDRADHAVVTVALASGGPEAPETTMIVTSTFLSTEQMEKMLAMGMAEGMTLAMGQIDAILASGD